MKHPRTLADEARILARSLDAQGARDDARLVRQLAETIENMHEARAYAG